MVCLPAGTGDDPALDKEINTPITLDQGQDHRLLIRQISGIDRDRLSGRSHGQSASIKEALTLLNPQLAGPDHPR
jgi:hypothetical protein